MDQSVSTDLHYQGAGQGVSTVEWNLQVHVSTHHLDAVEETRHVVRKQVTYIADPEAVGFQHLARIDDHACEKHTTSLYVVVISTAMVRTQAKMCRETK